VIALILVAGAIGPAPGWGVAHETRAQDGCQSSTHKAGAQHDVRSRSELLELHLTGAPLLRLACSIEVVVKLGGQGVYRQCDESTCHPASELLRCQQLWWRRRVRRRLRLGHYCGGCTSGHRSKSVDVGRVGGQGGQNLLQAGMSGRHIVPSTAVHGHRQLSLPQTAGRAAPGRLHRVATPRS
jgi:hypothetical protein